MLEDIKTVRKISKYAGFADCQVTFAFMNGRISRTRNDGINEMTRTPLGSTVCAIRRPRKPFHDRSIDCLRRPPCGVADTCSERCSIVLRRCPARRGRSYL